VGLHGPVIFGTSSTASTRSVARAGSSSVSGGGTKAAQRHARDELDAQLQQELERSRQRQVQGILLSSFDRQ